MTARWFGIRIDMLSALFLGAVGFGSIPLASGTYVLSNGEQQLVWWCVYNYSIKLFLFRVGSRGGWTSVGVHYLPGGNVPVLCSTEC